jgi:hypothetical protein
MDFKEPNILFLRGINIDDILEIEDIYHKELLNNIKTNNTEVNIIYDKIPSQFTSLDKWKTKTNLRCWYCTLKFKNTPWFIINNINHTANGNNYDISGNFCSIGCLQGHINVNYNTRDHFDIYTYVKKLYKIFYNKTIYEILPSPDKYNLKIYGGTMEILDYQKEIQNINVQNINNGIS